MEIDAPEKEKKQSKKRYESKIKHAIKITENELSTTVIPTQAQATQQPLPPQPLPSPRQVQNAIVHQRSTNGLRITHFNSDERIHSPSVIIPAIQDSRIIKNEPVIEKRITRSMKKDLQNSSTNSNNNNTLNNIINNINSKSPLQPVIEIQWREEIQTSNEEDDDDDYVPIETQICYDCGLEKLLNAFKSRRRNICIECQIKKKNVKCKKLVKYSNVMKN